MNATGHDRQIASLERRCTALEQRSVELGRQIRKLQRDRLDVEDRLDAALAERAAALRQRTGSAALSASTTPVAGPPAAEPAPTVVNKTGAARHLGVSVDFFDAHIASDVPCARIGRRRMYRVADLDSWLESNAERATWGRT